MVVSVVVAFVAAAEIPQDVKSEIDLRVKHELNPSIVVGLFENGESFFYTQGMINKDSTNPVDTNSVYEIGSITKTFTSLLLAQMAQSEKLKLDDAVQNYWSEPFSLEDSENQAVTFKHLATHTSGLPRLPNNFKLFARDPYADYDREDLVQAVNSTTVNTAGSTYDYSNFAVGLLGETLSVIANQSFNNLVETNIIKPLALDHTFMQLKQVPDELLVQGYDGNQAAVAWTFKALAGAGSIRSSIKDLLAYGVAHITTNHPLKESMDLTMMPHYETGGLSVGLGWHLNDGIIWHNGGTGGFKSIIMVDPENNRVAAGMTNNDKYDVEDIVAHLIDQSRAMKKHDFPVSIADEELPHFVGQFKHAGTEKVIQITHENQQLIFNTKGQSNQKLQFIGDDTFKFGIMKIKLKFNKDNSGKVESLSLMAWGKPQTYEKIGID